MEALHLLDQPSQQKAREELFKLIDDKNQVAQAVARWTYAYAKKIQHTSYNPSLEDLTLRTPLDIYHVMTVLPTQWISDAIIFTILKAESPVCKDVMVVDPLLTSV